LRKKDKCHKQAIYAINVEKPMESVLKKPILVLIVALPETAGSALYGMLDVLCSAGNIFQALVRSNDEQFLFQVRIVANSERAFTCGNGIPVTPDCSISDDPEADIIIVPELWLGPDETLTGRHRAMIDWLRRQYEAGVTLCSACSGAVLLAETGLLDGCPATSHWGYQDLFRTCYPAVKFDPAPNLTYADPKGRIITAGGTTSWHDLALHLIARYASPGEALRIAKVYLLKWHSETELPFSSLVRSVPHGDSVVKKCEEWLKLHFREIDAIPQVTELADIPERTLKRRFKSATGSSLIAYLQNLRVEEAKGLLETTDTPVDEISYAAGYADASFFRRVFKRLTGLTPSHYRKMFQRILAA
jgi:transcriptional regulator GlxA family with amidase domain